MDALELQYSRLLQHWVNIQALDGFGRFFPCGGEIVFELTIDPVDKFAASDDPAVHGLDGMRVEDAADSRRSGVKP